MRIAVYGTLKRGFFNHERFGKQEYIGDVKIRGLLQTYDLIPYFFLGSKTRVHSIDHTFEVFAVENDVYETIESVERGAGYYPVDIITEIGAVKIFVADLELLDPAKPYTTLYTPDEAVVCECEACQAKIIS